MDPWGYSSIGRAGRVKYHAESAGSNPAIPSNKHSFVGHYYARIAICRVFSNGLTNPILDYLFHVKQKSPPFQRWLCCPLREASNSRIPPALLFVKQICRKILNNPVTPSGQDRQRAAAERSGIYQAKRPPKNFLVGVGPLRSRSSLTVGRVE